MLGYCRFQLNELAAGIDELALQGLTLVDSSFEPINLTTFPSSSSSALVSALATTSQQQSSVVSESTKSTHHRKKSGSDLASDAPGSPARDRKQAAGANKLARLEISASSSSLTLNALADRLVRELHVFPDTTSVNAATPQYDYVNNLYIYPNSVQLVKQYRNVSIDVQRGPSWADQSLTALVEADDEELEGLDDILSFPSLADMAGEEAFGIEEPATE